MKLRVFLFCLFLIFLKKIEKYQETLGNKSYNLNIGGTDERDLEEAIKRSLNDYGQSQQFVEKEKPKEEKKQDKHPKEEDKKNKKDFQGNPISLGGF